MRGIRLSTQLALCLLPDSKRGGSFFKTPSYVVQRFGLRRQSGAATALFGSAELESHENPDGTMPPCNLARGLLSRLACAC